MTAFAYRLSKAATKSIGDEQTKIVEVSDFFEDPEAVRQTATAQSYAHINPHYPGIRAEVEPALLQTLCDTVSHLSEQLLGQTGGAWIGQAWYSLVTRPAQALTPIQRLPHFDGFDESQVAVMIYLDTTPHGGTAFYKHRSSGFERVTEARYPDYKMKLEQGVQQTGLPPAAYITDGAPHFDKIFESDAPFNSLLLYPGTSLHSGVIRNDVPLSPDPAIGRLTVNGFFRPDVRS